MRQVNFARALLVAAHADDELIGAGTLITHGYVSYVTYACPLPERRKQEALELAKLFNYGLVAFGEPKWPDDIDAILVPSPTDPHFDHQFALTRALARGAVGVEDTWEYSIEKNASYVEPLSVDEVAWKRDTFRRVYPSQVSELRDPKYFLFEGWAPLAPPSITVTFQHVGFHRWKDAPDDVAYLRNDHRHVFHVRLTLKDLAHHDRAHEFHTVKVWAEDAFRGSSVKLDASCEMMARDLAVRARVKYRCHVQVSVWEDGECGAEVTV